VPVYRGTDFQNLLLIAKRRYRNPVKIYDRLFPVRARRINNPVRSGRPGFVATAEDFVALLVLQDHFQAAPVLYVWRSHAWNVPLRGLHCSGP